MTEELGLDSQQGGQEIFLCRHDVYVSVFKWNVLLTTYDTEEVQYLVVAWRYVPIDLAQNRANLHVEVDAASVPDLMTLLLCPYRKR
jgi:hypothetical protein